MKKNLSQNSRDDSEEFLSVLVFLESFNQKCDSARRAVEKLNKKCCDFPKCENVLKLFQLELCESSDDVASDFNFVAFSLKMMNVGGD